MYERCVSSRISTSNEQGLGFRVLPLGKGCRRLRSREDYGGTANQLGGYWTTIPPSGPVQSIIDSALNPAWGNTATKVVKIKVPSGIRLCQGQVASQGGLVGGGNQVVSPKT